MKCLSRGTVRAMICRNEKPSEIKPLLESPEGYFVTSTRECGASTVQAPDKYGASTVQTPDEHHTNPSDSLIPDSQNIKLHSPTSARSGRATAVGNERESDSGCCEVEGQDTDPPSTAKGSKGESCHGTYRAWCLREHGRGLWPLAHHGPGGTHLEQQKGCHFGWQPGAILQGVWSLLGGNLCGNLGKSEIGEDG